MRVGLDATPLLGRRTGIGTYTAHLLDELTRALDPGDEVVATAFTLRGFRRLREQLPENGIRCAARPVPARAARRVWMRSDALDAQLLTGAVDVLHGTNFVLPPARGAAGVVTIHDLAYLRWPDSVAAATRDYVRLVPRSLARGAHVCTPSRAVAEQILDAYAVPPERVHVTPLGVDGSWADARPASEQRRRALGLPASYLVAVGTLEPRKNLGVLLDAYRLARARGVELPPLVLVGGSGWGPRLQTEGLGPSMLVLTGHLDFDVLQQVLAGSDGLLFPSLDEGFGLPPLEALACGVPVLAAGLPVLREVLEDQAVYVDASDAAAVLDGIQLVLCEPVGTAGSRRARAASFTWSRCAAATVTAYRLSRN